MILVTGGAGFIGSHLVRRLVAEGEEVLVFDSFDDFYNPEIKWRNIADLVRKGGVELVVGDIRDRGALDGAMARAAGVDAIVHLAARAGVRPSLREPALYADVNVTGTLRVLEAARDHGVGHVVMASSSSIYGDGSPVPFREERSEGVPVSPYGASKRAQEVVGRTFADCFGVRVTALRLFTAYGPGQRPDMAIHGFARRIEAGETVSLFGDGSSRRDYTYVADVVEGIRAALGRTGPGYREYNIGREESVELRTLIESLERALGKEARTEQLAEQPGDVRVTAADCSRAREELGYVPRVSLEEGLREFVRWLRAG